MHLLAETTLNWQVILLDYGPLGVFALVIALSVGWGVREWWKVTKPHIIAKQNMDIQQSHATVRLFETLRELEPQKVDILRRQQVLTESIREDQLHHAAECGDTKKTVIEIHQMVAKLAGHG